MDSFNNNFKSIDDDQNDLPQGFGWEEMKEGVYEKMPSKKRRRIAAWWWYGAVGLFAISFATWMLLDNSVAAEQSGISSTRPSQTIRPQKTTHSQAQEPNSNSDLTASVQLDKQTQIASTTTEGSQTLHANDNNSASTPIPQHSGKSIREEQRANRPTAPLTAPPPQHAVVATANLTSPSTTPNSNPQRESKTVSPFRDGHPSHKQALHPTDLSLLAPNELRQFVTPRTEMLVLEFSPPKTNKEQSRPREEHLLIESLMTRPTSVASAINAPYVSPWYGLGLGIGFQKQLSNSFSLSAQYSLFQVKEEFAFSSRDTTLGSNSIDRTIRHINSTNNSLLATSTISATERLDRQREVLSYNTFNYHQLSLLGHFIQPLTSKSSIDVGLGGGIQFLATAKGVRLDDDQELFELNTRLDAFDRTSVTLDGRLRYLHLLSPKLQLSTGINYSLAMQENTSNSIRANLGIRFGL